jgi:hypothetical protein
MIIEKHGGTIKAKSEGLDQGASFIIDLAIYCLTFLSPQQLFMYIPIF